MVGGVEGNIGVDAIGGVRAAAGIEPTVVPTGGSEAGTTGNEDAGNCTALEGDACPGLGIRRLLSANPALPMSSMMDASEGKLTVLASWASFITSLAAGHILTVPFSLCINRES